MHFLLLCILSSTSIFVIFKIIDRLGIASFPVILINYLLAFILGFALNSSPLTASSLSNASWLIFSVIIGVLFILMFFLLAYSSHKAGLSITTVASKMSVVFPILFSLALDPDDRLSLLKALAIVLALAGVLFSVYKPLDKNSDRMAMIIPLLLFIGMGVVDSLVKLAQHRSVADRDTAIFSAFLFLNAFLTGLIVLLFRRSYLRLFLQWKTWLWGILLGAVNFGSIYFLVRTLNYRSSAGSGLDSSVVFGANNISIVALSVMLGFLLFKERLRWINWIGILLSACSLYLFTQLI